MIKYYLSPNCWHFLFQNSWKGCRWSLPSPMTFSVKDFKIFLFFLISGSAFSRLNKYRHLKLVILLPFYIYIDHIYSIEINAYFRFPVMWTHWTNLRTSVRSTINPQSQNMKVGTTLCSWRIRKPASIL